MAERYFPLTTSDYAAAAPRNALLELRDYGFGPMTAYTEAGRPNAMLSAVHERQRPNDYMAPVAEMISPTLGAYGAGQLAGMGAQEIGRGNYAEGVGGLALGMAGMLPGAPKGNGIRAFHGSPHSFDRFDMSKIGTGEGAQAYGHGLYFAEAEDVARSYRDELSGGDITIGGVHQPLFSGESYYDMLVNDWLRFDKGDVEKTLGRIDREATVLRTRGVDESEISELMAQKARLAGGVGFRQKGNMYEVRINADPENFLDWDKPLSEQSEPIRNAMMELANGEMLPDLNGMQAYRSVASQMMPNPDLMSPNLAKRVRDAGIPGIKYLDQGSRSAGDGSRNYVVFDDSLVEILRKYGLLGTLGGGAAANAMLQDGEGY